MGENKCLFGVQDVTKMSVERVQIWVKKNYHNPNYRGKISTLDQVEDRIVEISIQIVKFGNH